MVNGRSGSVYLNKVKRMPSLPRIFAPRQGSADDAGQEGPLEGADAGFGQKDRRVGPVFGGNDCSRLVP